MRKAIFFAFLVFALVLVAFPAQADPAELHVGPGYPYSTIQDAVNAASPGDTIIVHETGTEPDYTENVDVTKSVTIREADGEDVSVKASDSNDHVFDIQADNVTIRGFDIYGATGSGYAGIYIGNHTGCTIEENRCGWDATHKNYRGIYLYNSTRNTILRNTCSYNASYGIYLYYESNENFVSENTCNNNHDGIYLKYSYRNIISGNTCSNNAWYGIYSYSSNENTITGNTCSDNESGMLLNNSDGNTITRNRCENNDGYALYLYGDSDNNRIYLNSFIKGAEGDGCVYSSGDCKNSWSSPTKLCYFYSSSHMNYLGNYYSDHDLTDSDNDGITDSEYDLPGSEPNDAYPLAKTHDNYEIQAWYLSTGGVMYEGEMGRPPAITTISGGESKVWVADEDADVDVTFPGDAGWEGQLKFTTAPSNGDSFKIEIGYWDGSTFTAGGPDATITGDGSKTTFTFTTDAESFTVPQGRYLAMRITNQSGSSYDLVTAGAWSYTTNPDTGAPNYPVPEIPSLILLGIALLILALLKKPSPKKT